MVDNKNYTINTSQTEIGVAIILPNIMANMSKIF